MKPDIKGLMKLGKRLARMPRSNFNQGAWWETTKYRSSCGTAGCVAGHAADMFPSRFKKVMYDEWTDDNGKVHRYYDIEHRRTGLAGSDAFAVGFRISAADAAAITDVDAKHHTPKQAAKAVFNLVTSLKSAK